MIMATGFTTGVRFGQSGQARTDQNHSGDSRQANRAHKISEPDVHWILEKWLARHPEINKRQKDIRIIGGSGWLIFNTHGLDDEGWGPIRATYLDRLLDKLLAIDSVDILPAGRALEKYVGLG